MKVNKVNLKELKNKPKNNDYVVFDNLVMSLISDL